MKTKWVITSEALLTHRLWSTPGWGGQFHFSPWPGTPSTLLWPPGPETWRVSVVPSYPPSNPESRMKLEAQVGSPGRSFRKSRLVVISVLKQHVITQYTSDSMNQEMVRDSECAIRARENVRGANVWEKAPVTGTGSCVLAEETWSLLPQI